MKNTPWTTGLLLLCFSAVGSAQINLQFGIGNTKGSSRSISVSNQNGIKVTKVSENGNSYVIKKGDDDSLEVHFSTVYGPNEMEQLKEKHPELHMHVTSFPKATGESKVVISIEVQEVAKASSEDELREKNPQAFEIYKKYSMVGSFKDERIFNLKRQIELGIDPAAILKKGFDLPRNRAKKEAAEKKDNSGTDDTKPKKKNP